MLKIENLNIKSLHNVTALQTIIYNYLDNKSQLETLSGEEFEVVLSQGYAAGVIEDGMLVAFRAFLIPDNNDTDHLANDVNVAKDDTIYSEVSLVHPDYRGQGLQTKMGDYLLQKVEKNGRFKYVLATVAPDNLPSLIDKFKLGFVIAGTKFKYQGKLRHILIRDMRNKQLHGDNDIIYVPYSDTEWMLDNGNNFIGIDIHNHDIMYISK